jgi:LEA14-like dessication related protein
MKKSVIRNYTFVIAIISLLLLSGCAGLSPSFEKPKVNLADIQVREIKTLETAFLVQLRIMNPNETPLEIQGLSCDLELDGRQFASGLQGEQLTVPPYGTALVPVDVYASMLDMVSSVIGLIQTAGQPESQLQSITYRLTGRVRVSTGSFTRSIPFESEGELNLK